MSDRTTKHGLAPKRSQPLIQGVAPAPLVGLKAQLQRARQGTDSGQRTTEVQATKLGAGLHNSIKNKKVKNSGVRERAAADVSGPIQNESDKLAASQAALERKSRLYDSIARGEADAGADYEVDFSTRLGSNAQRDEPRWQRSPSRYRRSLSPVRRPPPRRSPSPQYSSDDSQQPARRQSPTYEPFQAHNAAEGPSFEDGEEYDEYAAPGPIAPLSEHERTLLERKQGHRDAFEARRELREHEAALDEHRKNIIKEKVAAVQQEVAAERQAGTSKKRANVMDDSRRKALLKQVVAKKDARNDWNSGQHGDSLQSVVRTIALLESAVNCSKGPTGVVWNEVNLVDASGLKDELLYEVEAMAKELEMTHPGIIHAALYTSARSRKDM